MPIKILAILGTLAALFCQTLSFNLYNRIDIPTSTGASCLDGTPFGYYVWYPDQYEPRQNKLMIYFEETPFGWCIRDQLNSTAAECQRFMTEDNVIDYGSSKNWSNSETFLTGILSPFEAGEFNDWTKVYVRSCDGGLFMGDGVIDYRKKKINFKGSNNIIQMIKSLQFRGYLQVEEIVVAGSMNGAIAAMMWADTIKQYVDEDTAVRVIADSAIHLNQQNRKKEKYQYQSRMMMMNKVAMKNGAGIPNQDCVKQFSDEPWKCLFALNLQKYVKYPIFFTQSLYDGWSILFVLGFECAQLGNLKECPEKQLDVIIEYHKNVTEVMKNLTKREVGSTGIYAISCVAHQFMGARYNNQLFEVPMESGNKAMTVVSEWARKSEGDVSYFDEVDWPDNIPCAKI